MPTKIEKDAVTGINTTGHEWDGLRELDNPLPKWWLYVFYASILFALAWVVLYPALPIRGYTGLTGWTARGAIGPVLEGERARQEPMLARPRRHTGRPTGSNASPRNSAARTRRRSTRN